MRLVSFLLLAGSTAHAGYTAVWSIWANCDCSGPAVEEHTVATCAPTLIVAGGSIALGCSADGSSVNVHKYSGGTCVSGQETANVTYPVGQCLPNLLPEESRVSKFRCVKDYVPRKRSIVGRQFAGTACGEGSITQAAIAETNYVSGCFAPCTPPSFPLPNLWQVADASGLAGSLCNGTKTSCTSPCATDGKVSVGECQVLGKTTSVKYSYWPGE